MTKTTNEPNEIICECGHVADAHRITVHQCLVKDCRCSKTESEVYRSRLSTLEAAVEEQTETIKQLRKGLEDAIIKLEPLYRNDALRWVTMDVAQTYTEKMTAVFRALLAETAPKVQS